MPISIHQTKDDAEKQVFGYFRNDNDEIALKKDTSSQTSPSLSFAKKEERNDTHGILSSRSFISFLKEWWAESLWPGMGLFGESYLLFSIGTLTPLWKELYPDCWAPQGENNLSESKYSYYSAFESYTNTSSKINDACSPRLLESLTYGVVLGVIAGMVLLGYWSNHIGRRKGSILTASLMTGGSLGLVALSIFGAVFWSAENIFRGTVACLVLFGIGVGGEYPLSASLASEKATEELTKNQKVLTEREENRHKMQTLMDVGDAGNSPSVGNSNHFITKPSSKSIANSAGKFFKPSKRGSRVQLVFAMQGMGIWFNSLTMLVLLWALMGQSNSENNENDFEYDTKALLIVWRVTYGIGALVLCFVLLTRILYLEESKVWLDAKNSTTAKSSATQQQNVQQGNKPHIKKNRFKLVHQQYGSRMFGAGMTWLLWDISFYGNKLFQSTFLLALVGEDASLTELTGAAALNATIALLGYYGAAVLIDLPRGMLGGRKSLQSIGLVTTGMLFFACGWLASSSSTSITITLYLISSFVGQLGPNCTTFLIPAEIVPTDQRTYCHGICAASGKIGALIAAVIFHFVGSSDGGASLFYLCGFAGVLGAIVTQVFVPETAGLDLLELDLQWNILLSEEGSSVCYVGQAVHEDHLSNYERYQIRRSTEHLGSNDGATGIFGYLS